GVPIAGGGAIPANRLGEVLGDPLFEFVQLSGGLLGGGGPLESSPVKRVDSCPLVFRHTLTLLQQQGQVVLSSCKPQLGSPAIPLECEGRIVDRLVLVVILQGQVVLGCCFPYLGCLVEPAQGLLRVIMIIEPEAQPVHGQGMSQVRCLSEPLQGLLFVGL